jgi:signal transduction histidine kinase
MPPRAKARFLFISALILMVLSALATFQTMRHLLAAQAWVSHTREVQAAISRVNAVISRAGRTRMEFLETGDYSRLEAYQLVVAEVPPLVAEVKRLVGDNAEEVERERKLEGLVDTRLSLMQQSVALKQSGESTPEKQDRVTREIIATGAQMDELSQQMQDQEQGLLALRIARSRADEWQAMGILIVVFAAAILFFVLQFHFLSVELERREQAEAALRQLSARILEIQDQERRKISRELHDSLGQYLVSAKMSVDLLHGSMSDNPLLEDAGKLLDEALAETRTISHLLHPPLLDEIGFAAAARWYVEGFAKRSGIKTRLDLPESLERLPPRMEVAMFRILQEGLTNIHKHAKSTEATIGVSIGKDAVRMSVHDNGTGISPETLMRVRNDGMRTGVGLAGMRERIREFKGEFEISSNGTGTMIQATLPLGRKDRQETGAN